jgi:hypothetical protein
MNTDNSKVNTNLLKENEALKERIKELEELLTESRNHFLYATDAESGEPLADISTLINFWRKVNNALNPKTEN